MLHSSTASHTATFKITVKFVQPTWNREAKLDIIIFQKEDLFQGSCYTALGFTWCS